MGKFKFAIDSEKKEKIRKILDATTSSLAFLSLFSENRNIKYFTLGSHIATNVVQHIPQIVRSTFRTLGFKLSINVKNIIPRDVLFLEVLEFIKTKENAKIVKDKETGYEYVVDEEHNVGIFTVPRWGNEKDIFICVKTDNPDEGKEIARKYTEENMLSYYDKKLYILDFNSECHRITLNETNFDNIENLTNINKLDLLYEEINKYLSSDIKRSIMLSGEPGCGKSIAIKYIVKKLAKEKKTIVITGRAFDSCNNIAKLIKSLGFSYVIIDDFDRSNNTTHMLSELEEINKVTELFIVSVNNIEKLELAVKRPGRFDQVLYFSDFIDKNEFINQIEGLGEDVKNRLMPLNVASICEFMKRTKILGLQRAIETMKDLEVR